MKGANRAMEDKPSANAKEEQQRSANKRIPSLIQITARQTIEEEEARAFLALQERAFTYVTRTSAAVLAPIIIIFFLQGFRVGGFNLPKEFLYLLIAATLGKLAESMLIAMRFLFPQRRVKKRYRPPRTGQSEK
jgi:hypothetical protein